MLDALPQVDTKIYALQTINDMEQTSALRDLQKQGKYVCLPSGERGFVVPLAAVLKRQDILLRDKRLLLTLMHREGIRILSMFVRGVRLEASDSQAAGQSDEHWQAMMFLTGRAPSGFRGIDNTPIWWHPFADDIVGVADATVTSDSRESSVAKIEHYGYACLSDCTLAVLVLRSEACSTCCEAVLVRVLHNGYIFFFGGHERDAAVGALADTWSALSPSFVTRLESEPLFGCCSHCAIQGAVLLCPCGAVQYCSVACQKRDWKSACCPDKPPHNVVHALLQRCADADLPVKSAPRFSHRHEHADHTTSGATPADGTGDGSGCEESSEHAAAWPTFGQQRTELLGQMQTALQGAMSRS
jgi:hypothetical protein